MRKGLKYQNILFLLIKGFGKKNVFFCPFANLFTKNVECY